jgi:hypothetical protein
VVDFGKERGPIRLELALVGMTGQGPGSYRKAIAVGNQRQSKEQL